METQNDFMTVEEFKEFLENFSDPDGIAFACAMFEIKGANLKAPNTYSSGAYCCECPIAKLAKAAFGPIVGKNLNVTHYAIFLNYTANPIIFLSSAAKEFIFQYDKGSYPELELQDAI